MKRILFTLVAFLAPLTANAQVVSGELMGLGMSPPLAKYFEDNGIASNTLTNNSYVKSANATPSGTPVSLLKDDTANNTHLNAISGKVINLDIATTPEAVVSDDQLRFTGNSPAIAAPTSVVVKIGATPATAMTMDNTTGILFASAGQSALQVPFTATAVATPVTGTNFCPAGPCVIPTNAANNAVFIGAATPTPGAIYYIRNANDTNLVRAKAAGGSTINGSVAGGYIGLAANTSMICQQITAADLTCNGYSGGAIPTPAGP